MAIPDPCIINFTLSKYLMKIRHNRNTDMKLTSFYIAFATGHETSITAILLI